MPQIIVFCHLRWNFVYQRPQHLLSRLSEDYEVLFVEEPMHTDEEQAFVRLTQVLPHVTVLVPHTRVGAPGFHDDQLSSLSPLLKRTVRALGFADYGAWLYTPMALPLLAALEPEWVVYDCMDELSAFLGAPPELRERESALLQRADLVVTGGPSLYESKRGRHANVLCVPSAVDAEHFAPMSAHNHPDRLDSARALHAGIGAPRLGFYGVIDERLDTTLVAAMADARPDWHLVMVGPVVKIDPAALPQRPNLHWLGQQDYALLPQILLEWDVCLLPFALNDATRFISPTKTLEYMAAHKPSVSTAVPDVIALYADTVRIGYSAPQFISECQQALEESCDAHARRATAMAQTVERHSWSAAVTTLGQALRTLPTYRQPPAPGVALSIECGDTAASSADVHADAPVPAMRMA